jgi:hypothetical protein
VEVEVERRPYQSMSPSCNFLDRCLLRVLPDLSKREGWICGWDSNEPWGLSACWIVLLAAGAAKVVGCAETEADAGKRGGGDE